MAFLAIIRLRYFPPISIRRHSFAHGEPLHIRSYLSAWKMLEPHFITQCPMCFTTLNILLNRTLTTSLRRTILVILETYSWDVVIIIYGSIHINVFFALRQDVCLALWYPKMASRSILWRLPPSLIYQPQPPSLNSKVCRGKANFLRRFVCNFAKKTHGYICLLKKNTPFFWDD